MRQSPPSTLFPYTTLFRSLPDLPRVSPSTNDAGTIIRQRRSAVSFDAKTSISSSTFFQMLQRSESTRLNSSHLVISYAVFCLKKKKNNVYNHMFNQPIEHA